MSDIQIQLIHDFAAEQAVLATGLTSTQAFSTIVVYITVAEVFYDAKHRAIFEAMLKLYHEGKPTDVILVNKELRVMFPNANKDYLYELLDMSQHDAVDYMPHVHRLLNLYQRRQLTEKFTHILSLSQSEATPVDELVSEGCSALHNVLTGGSCDDIVAIGEIMKDIKGIVDKNLVGDIDKPLVDMFGKIRFYTSRLVVGAADTSQGKTALFLKCILDTACNGTACGYISLEMPGVSLGARLLGMDTGVKAHDILHRILTQEQVGAVDRGIGNLERLPIYFADRCKHSLSAIISTIRKMVWQNGVKLIVVDYAQILNFEVVKGRTDEMMLAEIARELQALAVELDICVVLLSQFNRDTTASVAKANINRLRGSAQIAEACDICLLLYRPEALNNGHENSYPAPFQDVDTHATAMITIAKDRHGDTDRDPFIIGFDGPAMKFYELDEIPRVVKTEITKQTPNRPF